MAKPIRITPLLILLVVTFAATQANAMNRILNLRHWAAPDHTRIVIDTSEVPEYTTEKSHAVVRIDFRNTRYPQELPAMTALNKPGVSTVSLSQLSGDTVRIEIALREHAGANVFKLSKIEDKPDRVVVDIELPEVEQKEATQREQVKITKKEWIVIIDPGHGGEDPGAIGPGGVQEKDVVLRISRMLRDNLNRRKGYRAYLTRNGDYYVPFSKRLKIAREYGADFFLSVHADAARSRVAQGASVYCLSTGGASTEAARLLAMNENLADVIGGSPNGETGDASDPIVLNMFQTNTINTSIIYGQTILRQLSIVSPLKFEAVQSAPFRVLKLPDIPSLLVETGYISNRKEERLLRSRQHQARIAGALAGAVMEILPAAHPAGPAPGVVLARKENPSVQGGAAEQKGRADAKPAKAAEEPRGRAVPARYYTVKRGDTLAKIAKRHDTTLAALLKLNGMKLHDPLWAGRSIKIAASEQPVPALPAAPATTAVETAKTRPSAAAGPEADAHVYRVRKGDSLARIAQRHNTTLNDLLKLNNMKLRDPLFIGRLIKIREKPAQEPTAASAKKDTSAQTKREQFTYYRVKKGETLEIIARRNGTTISQLRQLNRMKPTDPLLADQKLKLPLESSL